MQDQPRLETDLYEREDSSVALAHVVHTLVNYRYAIVLSILTVVALYSLMALGLYLFAPARTVTTLPFRLDFSSASKGEYPNGMKFTTSDIVSPIVLKRVYDRNDLGRFISYQDFSDSIFLMETNKQIQDLENEYRLRLQDKALTPIDRERLEREFTTKKESLSRNQYSVNFASGVTVRRIPPTTVARLLGDILAAWASYAREKGALSYQLPIFSAGFLPDVPAGVPDLVVATDLLRNKVTAIISSVDKLSEVPGAGMVRVGPKGQSLAEIRTDLEEVIRLQIEPLMSRIRESASGATRASSLRFIEAQQAYYEHRYAEKMARATALKDAYSLYTAEGRGGSESFAKNAQPAENKPETVMPQLTEGFLDRLATLSKESADREYRQRIVDQISQSEIDAVPYRVEADYYRELAQRVREAQTISDASNRVSNEEILVLLRAARGRAAEDLARVNDVYNAISRSLNPANSLFTVGGQARRVTERGIAPLRLALFGLFLTLATLVAAVVGALIHGRWKEEEEIETRYQLETPAAS